MADLITAAEAIRRMAVQYKAIVEVADLLQEVGQLENAAKEARATYDAAQADLAKAKADLAKVKEQGKKALDDHAAKAVKMGDEALATAEGIKHEAEVGAAEILKKAQDEAAALVAQAATEKARMSSELGGLQKSIVDAQTELAALLKAREAAIKSADDAESKLDGIRGKLKALAGL